MTSEDDRMAYATDGVDCHIHLFGDPADYPVTANKTYTPMEATYEQWKRASESYGVRRAVLVQPSVYGVDNRRLLQGLTEMGARARGVAVIDGSVPDSVLETMHSVGVRGVRLNFATGFSSDVPTALERLKSIARRVAHLGWHIQVLARGALLEAVVDIVPSLPVTVIFDHMAGAHVQGDGDRQGFQSALTLLRSGDAG